MKYKGHQKLLLQRSFVIKKIPFKKKSFFFTKKPFFG